MGVRENPALEKLASLFQRRYNIVSELKKETDELSEAMQREDNMSLDLLLDLRQEALNKLENNWVEMNLLAEESLEMGRTFQRLLREDPSHSSAYPFLERRILEERLKNPFITFRKGMPESKARQNKPKNFYGSRFLRN